ncbi:MAG: hypothetical protein WBF93_11225 [Pirellulales bacterium]
MAEPRCTSAPQQRRDGQNQAKNLWMDSHSLILIPTRRYERELR